MQAFAPANGRNSNKTQEEVVLDSGSHPIWQSPLFLKFLKKLTKSDCVRKGLTFRGSLQVFHLHCHIQVSYQLLCIWAPVFPLYDKEIAPRRRCDWKTEGFEGRKKVAPDWAGPPAREVEALGFSSISKHTFPSTLCKVYAPRTQAFYSLIQKVTCCK